MELTIKENKILNEIFEYTLTACNSFKREELTVDDIDDIVEWYVDVFDIWHQVGFMQMSKQSIGGVFTSLQEKGLIYPVEDVESDKGLMQFCITEDGMKHCLEQNIKCRSCGEFKHTKDIKSNDRGNYCFKCYDNFVYMGMKP